MIRQITHPMTPLDSVLFDALRHHGTPGVAVLSLLPPGSPIASVTINEWLGNQISYPFYFGTGGRPKPSLIQLTTATPVKRASQG